MSRYILHIFVVVCGVLLLSSCEKKELPIPPRDKGEVVTASVSMEEDYRWQIYYDLETNTVKGKNLKTAWDLGFETSADGYHIVLNTAKLMFAFNTGKQSMQDVTISDTTGHKKWDSSDGDLDSTAIGDWRGGSNVYIIDRGLSHTGIRQGYWKLQIKTVDAEGYNILFSKMDGSNETELTIKKDSLYNLSFLSLDEKAQVQIEPPKNEWDIVFTQYTHIFHVEGMAYMVTGCQLNRYNTSAALDTVNDFASIDAGHIPLTTFSSAINTIGYNWKNFDGTGYVTYDYMNYIISTRNSKYFKLHFIDFMLSGAKGHPKWEFQSL